MEKRLTKIMIIIAIIIMIMLLIILRYFALSHAIKHYYYHFIYIPETLLLFLVFINQKKIKKNITNIIIVCYLSFFLVGFTNGAIEWNIYRYDNIETLYKYYNNQKKNHKITWLEEGTTAYIINKEKNIMRVNKDKKGWKIGKITEYVPLSIYESDTNNAYIYSCEGDYFLYLIIDSQTNIEQFTNNEHKSFTKMQGNGSDILKAYYGLIINDYENYEMYYQGERINFIEDKYVKASLQ